MVKNIFVKRLHINIILMVFITLAVSGCSINIDKEDIVNKLQEMDKKIGNEIEKMDTSESEKVEDKNILTQEEKDKIDQWLKDKNLNRYGDSKSAIYKNGSPLFDGETGETIERFDYILNRYPNILE